VQTYKGNYHLLATVDGKERKFVIGKNKEEYSLIERKGIENITGDELKAMAHKYFKTADL
jgi:serine/threonine-protein kinase HipA